MHPTGGPTPRTRQRALVNPSHHRRLITRKRDPNPALEQPKTLPRPPVRAHQFVQLADRNGHPISAKVQRFERAITSKENQYPCVSHVPVGCLLSPDRPRISPTISVAPRRGGVVYRHLRSRLTTFRTCSSRLTSACSVHHDGARRTHDPQQANRTTTIIPRNATGSRVARRNGG